MSLTIIYELMLTIGLSLAMGIFYVQTQKHPPQGRALFKNLTTFILFCIGLQLAALWSARSLHDLVYAYLLQDTASPVFFVGDRQFGIVFYGGLMGILVFALVSAKLLHLPKLKLLDALVVPILIAHFWGRLGCFFRGCCYGKICDLPWALENRFHHIPVPRHPVQLYEAVWLALIIYFYRYRWPRSSEVRPGLKFATYLYLYAAGRFVLEFWRDDPVRGFIGSLSTSQFLSIVFIFIGILLDFVSRRVDNPKNEN